MSHLFIWGFFYFVRMWPCWSRKVMWTSLPSSSPMNTSTSSTASSGSWTQTMTSTLTRKTWRGTMTKVHKSTCSCRHLNIFYISQDVTRFITSELILCQIKRRPFIVCSVSRALNVHVSHTHTFCGKILEASFPHTTHVLGWWSMSEAGEMRRKINRKAGHALCSSDAMSGVISSTIRSRMTGGFIVLSQF